MDMCCDVALMMPSSYVVMNEDEMTYVEGGLSYNWGMRSKAGSAVVAGIEKSKGGYSKISAVDMAAEIYAHALAYYDFGLFLSLLSAAGVKKIDGIWSSVKNGIDLQNGLDKRKIGGFYYYQIFRIAYAVGPAFF